MKHRISAGAFVTLHEHVLLVHCKREGRYDFWVAPGGGVNHNETLEQAAEREVAEETGLQVRATRLLYIEEFFDIDTRYCKFWFAGEVTGGNLNTASASAADEFIVEAGWFNEASLGNESTFPEVLRNQYWNDLRVGVQFPQRLAIHEMFVR
jgi:8-oxo-dGTP diphosphatase